MDQGRIRSNRTAVYALTAALAAAACAWLLSCGGGGSAPDPGPGPDPDPDPDPAPTRVTLTGTVRDASGTALAGVQVLLGQNPSSTDLGGRFVYDNLLPGSYTVSLQDEQGNFDCREVSVSASASIDFELPAAGDGLRVVVVAPGLNAVGAALNADITLEFAGELDAATVEPEDFAVTPDVGALTVEVDGGTVALQPVLQLPAGQQTLVELTGEIRDLDGRQLTQPVRWRFRTSAGDVYPPQFIGTSPPAASTDHPPNSAVRFEFNEPLGPVDEGLTVTVAPPAELQVRSSGRYLLISASGGWELLTGYAMSVSGVPDSQGNRNNDTYGLAFITSDQVAPQRYVEPEWNRTAGLIVFAADAGGAWDIYSIRPDGTELTQLTALAGDERSPTVAADGSLLAYQHRDGGRWSIWVQLLEAFADPLQVTPDDYQDTQPQFSRTISNRIIFVSDRADPRRLIMINSDGSDPVDQDRDFGQHQDAPALHPLLDTQMLFTAGGDDNRNVWRKTVSAVDGSAINQNLTSALLTDEYSPDWGPDAGFIVYISDFAGVPNLWYAEATGEFERQVTAFAEPVEDVSVSPIAGEARAVVAVGDGEGASNLAIVSLVTGDVELWLTGGEALD